MRSFLNQIHPVEREILDEYLSHWQEYSIKKRSLITTVGRTERWMYLVQEGIQKSYYLTDEKEHVIAFTYSPSFSGILESFLTQTPSKYYLQSITDSKFLRLSFQQHQELMQEFRPIETLFRKAVEMFAIGMLERHYELMAYNIEKRFKSFVLRSPHLLNKVPHKDLASYLRIDATNFSKLLATVKV
ncbi:Crp/Fnr family transcriptional regulator [Fulvivirga sp. M361]|nr:Crp/Fnr family transcriptional regulator [Fulvivirga sp. M361]